MSQWSYGNPVWIHAGEESLSRLSELVGGRFTLVVTTEGTTKRGVTDLVRDRIESASTVYDRVKPNPCVDDVDAACIELRSVGAQLVLAVGGGSAIDTAKALAVGIGSGIERPMQATLREGRKVQWNGALPIIAVPTTAGTGSEVTPFATVWDFANRAKHSISGREVFPRHALLVPGLTVTQPWDVTLYSGLDAISHAMESLWNRHRNPVTVALAAQALETALPALASLRTDAGNLGLRTRMQEASVLAGLAISHTGTAIAHAISYYFTLSSGIAHGLACSFTLPRIASFCAEREENPRIRDLIAEGARQVGRLLESEGATTTVRSACTKLDCSPREFMNPERLSNFRFEVTGSDLDAMVKESVSKS